MEKAAKVNELLKREQDRHARKIANLDKQATFARQIETEASRKITITRISGNREEEAERHKQRIADLKERQRKILWG